MEARTDGTKSKAIATIVLTAVLAIGSSSTRAEEAAAIVNGIEITKAQLDAQVNVLIGNGQLDGSDAVAGLRDDVLEQLITQELLWQAAKARGYAAQDDTVDERLEEFRRSFGSEEQFAEQIAASGFDASTFREDVKRRLAVEQLISRDVAPTGTISSEEISTFYAQNVGAMLLPEEFRVSEIAIGIEGEGAAAEAAAHEKIVGILAELRSGADFAAIAREHSEGRTAPQGGDLGLIGRGQLVAPLEHVMLNLQPGEVSEVIRTYFGFHIIKLVARRGGEAVPEGTVAESIADYLAQQKIQLSLGAFIEELRAQSDVTVVLPD